MNTIVTSSPPMLELVNLWKLYRGIPSIQNVHFTLAGGEVVGYLGPNGAGKSTTVKIITGVLLITVLEAAEPYLGHPVEVAKGFKNELLESAWIEHRQWVSFDLVNSDVPKKQAYAVLAKLVSELLDARCAGIYLPKENQFTVQDRAAAAEHLSRLAR